MRSVTVAVTPPVTLFTAELFDGESSVTRERVYHANVLEDGTMVLLGRLRGDLDRARTLIEGRPQVLDYAVSDGGDGSGLVYVHARPPAEVTRLLELPRRHEVFFDFPAEITRDGRFRLVVVGETNEVLRRALGDVPPEIEVTVERIGAYPEAPGDLSAVLTDRQREVLDVALELGYYEVPRRATHGDVAERLGLSTATVGEHLQKIEARVFAAFAG